MCGAEPVMCWIGALCSSTERAKARLCVHDYVINSHLECVLCSGMHL